VLTKDNPKQSDQVGSVKIKTAEKLILIRKLLDDRNTNLLDENEKIEILRKGKVITDEIKDIISNINFIIETYATAELCTTNLEKKSDVIILDYHLGGIDKNAMNGIET
jgi:hypothetical protein